MAAAFFPFSGAKIALCIDKQIVAYKRDDKPDIPFPGLWDLPGGGREGNESPQQCALRETKEEFGLSLEQSRIIWSRYDDRSALGKPGAYFFAMYVTRAEIEDIELGDEGQYWALMDTEKFMGHATAVPVLQTRLAEFLSHPTPTKGTDPTSHGA